MKSASRRLILENRSGQSVRSVMTDSETMTVVYRMDTKRVELHSSVTALKESGIDFATLKTVKISTLEKSASSIEGVGRLRLAQDSEKLTAPGFELPLENDDKEMSLALKKASIGHLVGVALLIGLSFLTAYLAQKPEEPELVTITITPPKETAARKTVKMAEQKIKPIKSPKVRVSNRTTKIVKHRHVVTRKPVPQKTTRKSSYAVARPVRQLERVGALAALGGLKSGARNAEGLDSKSMRNIRSAGVGQGGGGIGSSGAGGARGMLPGSGLIAGSAGSGGRAESAGGYGTKGVGGGKAGYGKISLVGGTSGITLPLEEEAMVEGGLDRDQIAAVINRNKGQIIYCYEQGLQGEPDLRGRVSVQFVIGPKGRITTASVANSSLGSRSVESCMVSKMRSWQFPKPVGNVNVDVLYPFELRRVTSR